MEETIMLFSKYVCARLRSRINAKVYVNPMPDGLEFEIYYQDLEYCGEIENLQKMLCYGVRPAQLADKIEKGFREFVISSLFH